MAAKGKYNEETVNSIVKYLRAGNNQLDSAQLSGISHETYYQWIKTKPEFADAIKSALAECKARNIALIQKAGEKQWQAAAWWLERKFSDEFAIRQIQELQGRDGQEPTINIRIIPDAK